MWSEIQRKCSKCKQSIELDKDNVIYCKDKYYHFDCFIELQLNKKRNKLSKEEWIIKAKQIQEETKSILKYIVDKEKLFKWIQYKYNIVVLPKYFFIKMNSIFDGTYKGLSKGIPAEDILDMWQRKKKELDKLADNNKRKGKELDKIARVQYDLAIILSKYDSYLEWKEKQKLLELEKTATTEIYNKIDYSVIHKVVENQNSDNDDLSDILDEVF